MAMNEYKAYGKDRGNKNFHFVDVIQGRTAETAARTFQKTSKWDVVKVRRK